MAKRRTEVAGFTGVLAGLAIGAATLIATVGKQPVSNPWFIFFVVVAAASGVVFVAAGLAPVAGWVRRKLIARRKHKPLILDRWLYTTDGTKVPALAVAMEIRLPGTGTNGLPGTGRKPKDDLPPWVRYVVTMPCSEADHHDDPDSDYSRFESFLLQDDLVKKMVEVLTYMEGGADYWSRSASGPGIHDAVFRLGLKPSFATARLELPGEAPRHGRDPRCATFILHVQRGSELGGIITAQQPDFWKRQIQRALELPIRLQRLLADLGFQTSGKPSTQVGIRLEAPSDLAEMVNTTGRSELPGGTRGRETTGYFIAGRDGMSAEDAAATMVRDMLLHALKTTDAVPGTPEIAEGPSGQ
jgi:hypothetical protein